MLDFIDAIFTYPVPVWGVVLCVLILLLLGYLILNEALKGFIPSLERASEAVLKNNVQASEKYIELMQERVDEMNIRLDVMWEKHQTKIDQEATSLSSVNKSTIEVLRVLETSMTHMVRKLEAIKVLESEIIKLKNIIKRKTS